MKMNFGASRFVTWVKKNGVLKSISRFILLAGVVTALVFAIVGVINTSKLRDADAAAATQKKVETAQQTRAKALASEAATASRAAETAVKTAKDAITTAENAIQAAKDVKVEALAAAALQAARTAEADAKAAGKQGDELAALTEAVAQAQAQYDAARTPTDELTGLTKLAAGAASTLEKAQAAAPAQTDPSALADAAAKAQADADAAAAALKAAEEARFAELLAMTGEGVAANATEYALLTTRELSDTLTGDELAAAIAEAAVKATKGVQAEVEAAIALQAARQALAENPEDKDLTSAATKAEAAYTAARTPTEELTALKAAVDTANAALTKAKADETAAAALADAQAKAAEADAALKAAEEARFAALAAMTEDELDAAIAAAEEAAQQAKDAVPVAEQKAADAALLAEAEARNNKLAAMDDEKLTAALTEAAAQAAANTLTGAETDDATVAAVEAVLGVQADAQSATIDPSTIEVDIAPVTLSFDQYLVPLFAGYLVWSIVALIAAIALSTIVGNLNVYYTNMRKAGTRRVIAGLIFWLLALGALAVLLAGCWHALHLHEDIKKCTLVEVWELLRTTYLPWCAALLISGIGLRWLIINLVPATARTFDTVGLKLMHISRRYYQIALCAFPFFVAGSVVVLLLNGWKAGLICLGLSVSFLVFSWIVSVALNALGTCTMIMEPQAQAAFEKQDAIRNATEWACPSCGKVHPNHVGCCPECGALRLSREERLGSISDKIG